MTINNHRDYVRHMTTSDATLLLKTLIERFGFNVVALSLSAAAMQIADNDRRGFNVQLAEAASYIEAISSPID